MDMQGYPWAWVTDGAEIWRFHYGKRLWEWGIVGPDMTWRPCSRPWPEVFDDEDIMQGYGKGTTGKGANITGKGTNIKGEGTNTTGKAKGTTSLKRLRSTTTLIVEETTEATGSGRPCAPMAMYNDATDS